MKVSAFSPVSVVDIFSLCNAHEKEACIASLCYRSKTEEPCMILTVLLHSFFVSLFSFICLCHCGCSAFFFIPVVVLFVAKKGSKLVLIPRFKYSHVRRASNNCSNQDNNSNNSNKRIRLKKSISMGIVSQLR